MANKARSLFDNFIKDLLCIKGFQYVEYSDFEEDFKGLVSMDKPLLKTWIAQKDNFGFIGYDDKYAIKEYRHEIKKRTQFVKNAIYGELTIIKEKHKKKEHLESYKRELSNTISELKNVIGNPNMPIEKLEEYLALVPRASYDEQYTEENEDLIYNQTHPHYLRDSLHANGMKFLKINVTYAEELKDSISTIITEIANNLNYKNKLPKKSFTIKAKTHKSDRINEHWECMKNNGFIKDDTPKSLFKMLFSYKPIPFIERIIWIGNLSELIFYLTQLKKLNVINQHNQLQIAEQTFLFEGDPYFPFSKKRKQDPPSKDRSEKLLNCIELLTETTPHLK